MFAAEEGNHFLHTFFAEALQELQLAASRTNPKRTLNPFFLLLFFISI